jgi:hypothetical protein
MLVDPLLGLLDPRADQSEQQASNDHGHREADQGKSQSLKVIHGVVLFTERLMSESLDPLESGERG